jgi:hypothetical protein
VPEAASILTLCIAAGAIATGRRFLRLGGARG